MPVTSDAFAVNHVPPDPPQADTAVIDTGEQFRINWEARQGKRAERLAKVEARASAMDPGRAAATVFASVFVGVAWILGRIWRITWRVLALAVASFQLGWREGTGRGPTKGELIEENAALRTELGRWSGDEHAAAVIGSTRR